MAHVLIKYANVLISICVGEGSQHSSAIDLLGANEIHTFAIYGTRPCTAILDVNFVQQVLEKTIVWSFIHLT